MDSEAGLESSRRKKELENSIEPRDSIMALVIIFVSAVSTGKFDSFSSICGMFDRDRQRDSVSLWKGKGKPSNRDAEIFFSNSTF